MTTSSGWIGSGGEHATVAACDLGCCMDVVARLGGKETEASLTRDEAKGFTNATLRAMREIDPHFVPDGFAPAPEGVRPDVQPVQSSAGARAPDRQPSGRGASSGHDPVERPHHYMLPGLGGIELLDVIEALELDDDAYLTQAFQYIARCRKKGSFKEDVRKAIVYLGRRLGCEVELKDRVKQ